MMCIGDFLNSDFDSFLAPRGEFSPFPTAGERAAWTVLDDTARRRVLGEAEALLSFDWPSLPAERYLDYARNGDRGRYQNLYFERRDALGLLTVAECIERTGRFLDQILNGVWLIMDEATWVVPAHNAQRRRSRDEAEPLPDVENRYIDLFAAETGALLAWVEYLVGTQLDGISPLIRRRISDSLEERIIEPYLRHDDFWWMAFDETERSRINNWNPWCNSNCLVVSLLADPDEDRRLRMVRKACRSVDHFIDSYAVDGGCDEGPSYWGRAGAALFDCLELLSLATGGRVDLFGDERIGNIGRYIARAQIADDYYVNFADCVPRLNPPADLVFRFGRRIGNRELERFGLYLHRRIGDAGVPGSAGTGGQPRDLFRYLHALFDATELAEAEGAPVYPASVWFPSTQVAVFRSREGSTEGFVLAAKGGHNGESHNHNDVGQVIVFRNGLPILVDPGVEAYTAKTFSDRRYEIWTMQSAYHNLPTIAGELQFAGKEAQARDVLCDDSGLRSSARLSLELAAAYPPEAGIHSWRRTATLDREADAVVVSDELTLESEREVVFNFITPVEPTLTRNGVLLGANGDVILVAEGAELEAEVDRVVVDDERLRPHWGPALYRLRFSGRMAAGIVTFTMRGTD